MLYTRQLAGFRLERFSDSLAAEGGEGGGEIAEDGWSVEA